MFRMFVADVLAVAYQKSRTVSSNLGFDIAGFQQFDHGPIFLASCHLVYQQV